MKITKFNSEYIKLESEFINGLIANPSSYSTLYVEGKSGCNKTLYSSLMAVSAATTNSWTIDLTVPVKLENTVYQLFIKNLFSQKEYNCIVMPIDLGYVADTCTLPDNSCTLQLYSAVVGIQFKDQIDMWFDGKGITSNVTITFSGNIMTISNVPAGFGFSKLCHNQTNIQPYQELYFGFGNNSGFILAEDGILVKPSFFSETTLQDGVYKMKLRLTKTNNAGYIEEEMCAFIDISLKCQVAQFIKTLSEGTFSDDANSAMLLHYALVTGSNCGCNCDELCTVYDELISLINNNNINPITNDCGC